jgi:hypothetical protein
MSQKQGVDEGVSGATAPGGRIQRVANFTERIDILTEKFWFSGIKNFKLMSSQKANSINGCDFLKIIISVRGGHCGQ